MGAPTHLRTHAHRRSPPRTTARAASNTRRARPACTGAPPGRKAGAYLIQRGDRGGVPRADVRVERRRTLERLRAEPPAVHADRTRSHVSARMRGRPIPHAHTRARTQHVRSRVRRARIGDPFVRVASRMDTAYMHALGIHTLYICVFHRWMALRSERVALAHMPRISASSAPARDRTRMQGHTRVPIYMPRLCVDICTHIVHDVCVGYIFRRICPHVRT
jgi:hypothetical protein